MTEKLKILPVSYISDLMTWDDYDGVETKKRVRVRLSVTENGLEIIADGPYPKELEALLSGLDIKVIECMICG
jgi:hypothetical protein